MTKMEAYEFSAPWLNGTPIDAPNKIDMIDWYSQTDGYYPNAAKNDSKNCMLTILRFHGTILYNDEFYSKNTTKHDDFQITGRVKRVFTAIDKIREYQAACEDGADLSMSAIVDFDIVWRDHDKKVLPVELMHNLQQVKNEIESRPPENIPVKAFWMGQEIQRSKWTAAEANTNNVRPDHPNNANYLNDPTDHGTDHDAYHLQSQSQYVFRYIGQGQGQRMSTVLDPTIAIFVPTSGNTPPQSRAHEAPIPPENRLNNWWDSNDDYQAVNEIFTPLSDQPNLHRSERQLFDQGHEVPQSSKEDQSDITQEPTTSSKAGMDIRDSGYSSGVAANDQVSENEFLILKNVDMILGNEGLENEASQSERTSNAAARELSQHENRESEHNTQEEFQAFLRTYATYNLQRPIRYDGNPSTDDIRKRNEILRWLVGTK